MSEISMERSTLLLEEILDKEWLQKQQEYFCNAANLFAYCVDLTGKPITRISGEKEQKEQIYQLIEQEHFQELFDRITGEELEDQIIETTKFDNVKIAVFTVTDGSKRKNPLFYVFLAGIISNNSICTKITTEEQFLDSIDLIRNVYQKIFQTSILVMSAEAETRRSRFSQQEAEQSLSRIEAMTGIVQLLESDESIDTILGKLLEICGTYLQISSTQIFRLLKDKQNVGVLAQWYGEGVEPLYELEEIVPVTGLMLDEKLLVISSDSEIDKDRKALVSIPIFINGAVSMFAAFQEQKENRSWKTEEVKFMNDAVRIMQSIIVKRIQKNSLAGSYASLEAILDNVGSAIYVKDSESQDVLFVNKIMKCTFEKEMREGTFEEILISQIPKELSNGKTELFYEAQNKWYDLYFTDINWVDGRKVTLYAIYDITDKKDYQKKIEQQAYTDFLTGLYNRLCCERDLKYYIKNTKDKQTEGALLYLDLDDFKHINDGLGHQYGDVLLKSIAHSMQNIEGISDTCYRMGGDEFVIIVSPECYDKIDGIIDQIKEIFNKPWFLKDADYYCTMSMGVVRFPKEGDSVQDLIKKADITMYEAKKSGKNRVANYTDSSNAGSTKRLDMEKNMRAATAGGFQEFAVYFQPIIDNKKAGRPCTGAEALIRWNSTELGFLSPQDFIPLAEYLGLINPIGNYVLKEACKCCREWNVNGHPNYKVNVNLSVVQLLQPDIVNIIQQILADTKLNPKNLTLEVTESLAIHDTERMKEILFNVKKLGVRIALDDFGTGYSSLNHIREFPFDVIKVDQSFVRGLSVDSYSQSFIKMVSELADVIGVSVCVEGIETKEQYDMMEMMKVRLIQGFYFDKPMPKEVFEKKYVYVND